MKYRKKVIIVSYSYDYHFPIVNLVLSWAEDSTSFYKSISMKQPVYTCKIMGLNPVLTENFTHSKINETLNPTRNRLAVKDF